MKKQPFLASLAGKCARNPWRVVSIWGVIFLAAAILAGTGLNNVLNNEFTLTGDFDSVVGLEVINNSSLSDSVGITETIVIQTTDGTTVDDPDFRAHTDMVTGDVRVLMGDWVGEEPAGPPDMIALSQGTLVENYVLNYFEIMDVLSNPAAQTIAQQSGQLDQIESLVSADRTTLLLPVVIHSDEYSIANYIDAVEQFDTDRFEVTTIGNLSINEEYQELILEELITAEMFGVPIAVIVLLIVFGSLVAPVVPLVLGVMSVVIALGAVTILGQFSELQLFVQNMITMLGLAIGIDYSLFLVERFREQRSQGNSKQKAIEVAASTSGKAVIFSGVTLILAMLGVMLVRMNIFYSLAVGAITVISVTLMLTATMVPALLSLVGDRIDWPRKKPVTTEHIGRHNMYSGFWGTITKVVVARPWVSLFASVAVLLALAFPVLQMDTGFSREGQLPPGDITDAYMVLEEDFSAGLLSPMYVVFAGDRTDEADAAIADYLAMMDASGDFTTISEPRWDDTNRVAEVQATLAFEGSSEQAYDTVDRMRDEYAPETIGQISGLDVHVSGQSAGETDMVHHLGQMTPWVFVFVLGLSYLLLMVAFRTVVMPLQALAFNLLSVGAAWGILVSVFVHGFGIDIFGYTQTDIIELWLPILMFCILFGLSMDYHVFIVSRIREHYDISHDNQEAVAVGLRSTGRIITGAAAIMVVVFGAFSMGSAAAIQQLGFGLAVAVLIDATVIRTVLLPSVMTICGDWNWHLPKWLDWLPDIRIEGEAPETQNPETVQNL